jgi:hypothetical protein
MGCTYRGTRGRAQIQARRQIVLPALQRGHRYGVNTLVVLGALRKTSVSHAPEGAPQGSLE